jgi:hypothetical protein
MRTVHSDACSLRFLVKKKCKMNKVHTTLFVQTSALTTTPPWHCTQKLHKLADDGQPSARQRRELSADYRRVASRRTNLSTAARAVLPNQQRAGRHD